MRTLIICGAAVLALAACQRPATNDAATEADGAVDATAVDATTAADAALDAATGGSTSSGSARSAAARPDGSSTPAAGIASADAMGSAPAPGDMISGPSEATRANAKEKAEQTNLHPSN